MIVRQRYWRFIACVSRCNGQRGLSSAFADRLDRPFQSYISKSADPYLNLSIEHYMLQKSRPDSVILFLYVNRPCVVIGRNQNPWLEANLSLLKPQKLEESEDDEYEPIMPSLGEVNLVRRRSGGGTVFHDEGNVNWTVISPSADFTRDKHAEMVVRALRRLDVGRSRVNERHDIVLDQGRSKYNGTWGPGNDTHATPWQKSNPARRGALKVSGSAYKLTKGRALHHGTALLQSPNLRIIPEYLRSPAKDFIKGRGVDSVSSPVGNIQLKNNDFIERVQDEFRRMYGHELKQAEVVDESWLEIEELKKGYNELKSHDWTYSQTPQFTISNRPNDVPEPTEGDYLGSPYLKLTVRNGAITGTEVELPDLPMGQKNSLKNVMKGLKLHEIPSWHAVFSTAGVKGMEAGAFVHWLEAMLPVPSSQGCSCGHSHGDSHDHSHSH